MTSLKANFFYQSAWQLLQILVPLITTPYLSRVLGAEQIGVYSYSFTVAYYFVLFSTLGISTYGVRSIAACGNDRKLRSRVFSGAYGSQLLTGGIAFIAYLVYSVFSRSYDNVVTLVWGMYVLSALLDVSWLMFGVQEFRVPTIRSVFTKVISVIVILAFVKEPEDLWIYCIAIAGGFLLNQLLIWPFVSRFVDIVKPTRAEILNHLASNAKLFIPVIAISLYGALDKLMLAWISGMTQTGFFEYSEKLCKLPLALVTAMGTIMLPRMSAELSNGGREQAFSLLGDSVWVMLLMAFAFGFGIVAIAPEFAIVFLGKEFSSCDNLMRILACTLPIISLTNLLGRQYLLPMYRDNCYTLSVCAGAIVNIVTNLMLIPHFAAVGAAISSVLAEFAVLIVQAAFARAELPLRNYFFSSIPFVVCGLVMVGTVRLCASVFNLIWNTSVAGLALEILIGAIVYSLLVIIWCVTTRDARFFRLFRRLKESCN